MYHSRTLLGTHWNTSCFKCFLGICLLNNSLDKHHARTLFSTHWNTIIICRYNHYNLQGPTANRQRVGSLVKYYYYYYYYYYYNYIIIFLL